MSSQVQTVYLNGEFLPIDQARVSVMDRGFLFGDGVYEVIPVYGGRPLRLDEHLERLDASLKGIGMVSPLNREQWQAIFEQLIAGPEDQSIYLQVTRGYAPKRDHAFPSVVQPTIFVMCNPIAAIPASGVAAITLDDTRWQFCNIKAVTLLANVLLKQEAVEHGAAEALLVRDGHVLEGSSSNVFVLLDGMLITPPKGHQLLPGITRDLVLELAARHGIPYVERHITLDELRSADEVWVTSSTREVLPVVTLDGVTVGTGVPGALWERMNALYQDYKIELRHAHAGGR
ncbi:MAG: hypothetical protein RIQ52_1847 [Pseudomonadota bacterium]|jgi:D-alanine transaminase